MKLQTKLLSVLLTGILLVYFSSCLLQRHFALSQVQRFSQTRKAGELERQWRWVDCVRQAMTTSLEHIMATGDMDMFEKVLRQQAGLPDLLEASLTDHKGHVAYSTVPARLHGELPAELKSSLLAQAELVKQQTNGAFEIYKPLIAQKDCVSCHTERHPGEVLGVLSLRFSDQALKGAEGSWDQFSDEFSRANTVAAVFTTVSLTVILTVLVFLSVRFLLCVPLKRVTSGIVGQSGQVRLAANQFSGSSQSLAEGAGELAASIQESSAALAQLTSTTAHNN